MIESDEHIIQNNNHTMTLNLAYLEEINEKQEEENKETEEINEKERKRIIEALLLHLLLVYYRSSKETHKAPCK